jgi:tetratricopeptide (TPR) repeat protein
MRKRLLVLTILLVAVVSVVTGFYALRNTIADRFDYMYFARGSQLSSQDAVKLERKLKSDPSSFADRIELLAFYSFKTYKGGLTPQDLANRREYILWVIEHEPTSKFAADSAAAFDGDSHDPDGMNQAKDLWLRQVRARPTNARILYNAGEFFSWADGWQQSEELLERAYAIESTSHEIAASLAGLYWRDARHSTTAEQVTSAAAKSLAVFEQALKNTHDPVERLNDLPQAAQAAFEAGQYDQAATYSTDALNLAAQPAYIRSNADAIHYGNIVLGRIALRHGDVANASAYLVKAGVIKGSPHLETFGPNMMLAKELLERGERKSVLDYFDLCAGFWADDEGKLNRWRSAVLTGNSPDFGANLRY